MAPIADDLRILQTKRGLRFFYVGASLRDVSDAALVAAYDDADRESDCAKHDADEARRWGAGKYEPLRPEFRTSAASPDLPWLRDLFGYDPDKCHLYVEMYMTLVGDGLEECAVLSTTTNASGGTTVSLAEDVVESPQPTIIVPVRELQERESTDDGYVRRYVF